jgi:hypothetical protein
MNEKNDAAPTLLGSTSAASGPQGSDLPTPAHGAWRIELRYLPIKHRGHAYLALIDPAGRVQRELHGLSCSRQTGDFMPLGADGSRLAARTLRDDRLFGDLPKVGDAAAEISSRNFDYKSHDPSYEAGGDGGQIQNSNSVTHTIGRAMALDLDKVVRAAGMERRFSGWGRNLLDPAYRPYVAPPPVAVTQTP